MMNLESKTGGLGGCSEPFCYEKNAAENKILYSTSIYLWYRWRYRYRGRQIGTNNNLQVSHFSCFMFHVSFSQPMKMLNFMFFLFFFHFSFQAAAKIDLFSFFFQVWTRLDNTVPFEGRLTVHKLAVKATLLALLLKKESQETL